MCNASVLFIGTVLETFSMHLKLQGTFKLIFDHTAIGNRLISFNTSA